MKLSIITINYNNREGLRKTLESVKIQTTREFEYIVIDGGSTDGSVDVIKEYADIIDHWVSEPDKGIYNAMNKGVAAAHGEYCQFLNSGDWLYDENVINTIIPYLGNNIDILTGYTNVIDSSGKLTRRVKGSPKYLSLPRLLNKSLSHPSSYIKTILLHQFPYDENMKIAADWKFFVESYVSEARYAHIELDIAIFDTTGISSTMTTQIKAEEEEVRNSIAHPILMQEIEHIPTEIINSFRRIPDSYRLQSLISRIVAGILSIYFMFKPTKTINMKDLPRVTPPIMLKKKSR